MEKDLVLIEEVQAHEILWNTGHPHYKNNSRRSSEWGLVAQKVNLSKEKCQIKWKTLSTRYRSELRKVKENVRSGNGLEDSYFSPWPLFESLSFLEKSVTPATTTGNLEDLLNSDNSSSSVSDTVTSKSYNSAEYNLPESSSYDMSNKRKTSMDCNKREVVIADEQNDLFQGQDMLYFRNLLPYLKGLNGSQKLMLQTEINSIVFKYAYPGKDWSSFSHLFPTTKSLNVDDDDVQLVKVIRAPSKKIRIKQEPDNQQSVKQGPADWSHYSNGFGGNMYPNPVPFPTPGAFYQGPYPHPVTYHQPMNYLPNPMHSSIEARAHNSSENSELQQVVGIPHGVQEIGENTVQQNIISSTVDSNAENSNEDQVSK